MIDRELQLATHNVHDKCTHPLRPWEYLVSIWSWAFLVPHFFNRIAGCVGFTFLHVTSWFFVCFHLSFFFQISITRSYAYRSYRVRVLHQLEVRYEKSPTQVLLSARSGLVVAAIVLRLCLPGTSFFFCLCCCTTPQRSSQFSSYAYEATICCCWCYCGRRQWWGLYALWIVSSGFGATLPRAAARFVFIILVFSLGGCQIWGRLEEIWVRPDLLRILCASV